MTPSTPPSEKTVRCPNCGMPMAPGVKFCESCGKPADLPQQVQDLPPRLRQNCRTLL